MTGIDQAIVASEAKKKAVYFSDNIINLEKKRYDDLFVNHDGGAAVYQIDTTSVISELVEGIPPTVELSNLELLEEACKYSYIKRFLLKQTLALNNLLLKVKADVGHIQSRTIGHFKANSSIDLMLEALGKGKVPKEWKQISGKDHLDISDWIQRLRDQHVFFTKLVENNFLKPNVFNLKLIADPRGLLDAYHLDCANQRAPTMRFDEIVMTYKLTTVFERNSGGLPMVALYKERRYIHSRI